MIPNIFFILFTLAILYFCFGLCTLFLNMNSLRNRIFFSLCIHLSVWAFGYAFMAIAPNLDSANSWRMVSAFGWCFIYSVWLDFTIIVKMKSKKWMSDIRRLFIYLPGLFFFIGNFKYAPNKVITRYTNIWKDVYPLSSFEILYIIYYLVFVIAGIFIIYKWGKDSKSKIEKKQSGIIVITALLTIIVVALIDTILPLFNKDIFHLGIIIFSIALCGIWYTITKYKMMAISSKVAYEYILRTIDDPVILIGNDLLIKEVNNATLKITGYEEKDINHRSIQFFVDSIEKNINPIQTLLRAGGVKNLEVRLLTKSNNYVPCLLSGATIYNDVEETVGIACIFHDITERKNVEKMLMQSQQELEMRVLDRTIDLKESNKLLEDEINERKRIEEELKSSEGMFRSLMKQSSDGIMVFDPFTLKIFESNETICNIIEYTEEELLNLNIDTLLPIVNNTNMGLDDDSIQKKFEFKNEISTLKRRDGTIRNIQFSTAVVRYSNKQFITVTLIDITEKLIMEEKQQQTAKMEALGTLAGGIAHDFNNILAGIIGYTQLSLEDEECSPPEENLLEVLKLGERAKKLISKILTFSRKSTIEPHIVDMKVIVEEIIKMLKITTPSSIEIEYNFQTEHASVFADPGELQQLIMNLCLNGVMAMQNMGGKLQVTLTEFIMNDENNNQHQTIKPGKYIKIQVIDNGCGIEKYIIERIFEPFYTTRGVQGGTGLGLSVVHGIVSRNGGLITVDSIVNEGSTFTVFLPAATADSRTKGIRDNIIINSSARILLVDDEEAIINSNQKLLQRQGYLVMGVIGGKKALKIFKQNINAFDIVISDLAMPGMDGDFLIKEIRSIRSDIPIILCSGYSYEINDDKINSMDLVEFLLKPVSKNQYVNAIEKLIKSRR